ncbi:hypothetical protein DSO57_1028193 [Entomophthora muscae]|uniref:Uncharacterized protein n=1 Tax=Entomophthora muscae TaxID=34485 RepID=A0ACC2S3J9_9FUNG|nr:hypothetical protein DSO57_1028193 [Entomophthora muscae]
MIPFSVRWKPVKTLWALTVEAILGYRKVRNQVQYLVSWVGYPPESSSWELAKNLANAPDLITQYRQQVGHPKGEGKATVKNIPDNKLFQGKDLCSVGLTEHKKLQQFPLIGETAEKQPHIKSEIENSKIQILEFIPLLQAAHPACPPAPASQAPCQPASQAACSRLPARLQGTAHPPRRACPPLPDGEIDQLGYQKRQFHKI